MRLKRREQVVGSMMLKVGTCKTHDTTRVRQLRGDLGDDKFQNLDCFRLSLNKSAYDQDSCKVTHVSCHHRDVLGVRG